MPSPDRRVELHALEDALIQGQLHGDLAGIAKLFIAALVNDQPGVRIAVAEIVNELVSMD